MVFRGTSPVTAITGIVILGIVNLELVDLLIRVPIVLLALTVHEFCHAYFAFRMGDPTAMRMGRCTLNPLKHLDPLGTIILLFAPIGWAKPVPVNPLNFDDPRKGDLITSAAGPASNFVQAIVFALLMRIVIHVSKIYGDELSSESFTAVKILFEMCFWGVMINVGLAVFNCLPLFPLDGYHIFYQLMKPESQQRFAETATYGPFMILGLVLINNFTKVKVLLMLIGPPVELILYYIAGVEIDIV
ncbi:MAG: site-2 protease family protein [Planctomycetota bacterium]|jgi:Zn-dependent protease